MNILIVKTSAIGDVIQTFPVVEYLRKRFPEATIHWVVEKGCASLIEGHPLVDAALIVDTKKWRKRCWQKEKRAEMLQFFRMLREYHYDVLFDLQGNSKSGLITVAANATEKIGFGLRSVPEKLNLIATRKRVEVAPHINVRERYLQVVQSYFQDALPFSPKGIVLNITTEEKKRLNILIATFPKRPVFMVCFGSNWPNKQLSDETLKSFLCQIQERENPYFLFIYSKAQGEEEKAKELQRLFASSSQAIGEMSLPFWQALMGHVDLVMAMDSAGLHLAGTTATPTFSIFGPSLSHIYRPLGLHHSAHQGVCPYGRTFIKRCPVLRSCPTGACIRSLSADILFNKFIMFFKA